MTVRPEAGVWPGREALATRIFARYMDLIDDPDALMGALLRPLPQTLWANTLRIDRQALMDLFREDGVPADAIAWTDSGIRLPAHARPGLHWGFFAGLFQVQEEVSMIPVRCLDPKPGQRVLDLCAAPGNKTAQMAVAMGNRGTVVANDLSRGRMPAVRQAVKRLGLVNVSLTVRDGQGLDARAGQFDRVLVDAPCTCEGTFRKSSVPQCVSDDVRLRTSRVQKRLLQRGLSLLRPGGRLVYSTCTFSPEENEAVVDAVLRENVGDVTLRPAGLSGLVSSPGLTAWGTQQFLPELTRSARYWPHQNDTGGFFVAVFEKHGDGAEAAADSAAFQPASEPTDWLQPLSERFGLDCGALLEGMRLIRRGGRHVHLLASDHAAPMAPAPDAMGLPAVRRRSLPLKLTTAAVLLLGRQASRNRLALTDAQFHAFVRRETTTMDQQQLHACTGPGHVVVCYRGYPVGLGQLIYDRATPTVWLKSFMPAAWGPAAVDEAAGQDGDS